MGEVLLALIFATAFPEQAVGPPNALQGAVAEGKIELADEAASTEGGHLLTQSHDLLLDVGRSFARLMMGRTGEFEQPARSLLLEAAQPLAHGGDVVWNSRAVGLMPHCRAA